MTAGPVQAPTTRAPRGTLGDALSGRDNALNFVRLILASMVIVGHAGPIMGVSARPEVVELGNWAVNGFFVASGFLIAGSRGRSTWWGYMWRRALRIFPAFWVALLVVAFVLAPLSAVLTGDSVVWRSALGYPVRNAAMVITQPEVANTLTGLPIPHVWLGTAWTLSYEFAAYLIFGAMLGIRWVRERGLITMGALTIMLMIGCASLTVPPGASGTVLQNGVRLGSYFALGALFWFLRDRVRPSWWLVGASTLAIVVLWGGLGWERAGWFAQLPLGALVLALGALLPVRLGARNDISYGIYLYGWPAQQFVMILLGAGVGIWVHSLIALALAVVAAAASWWLVEKPAMRLRRLVT